MAMEGLGDFPNEETREFHGWTQATSEAAYVEMEAIIEGECWFDDDDRVWELGRAVERLRDLGTAMLGTGALGDMTADDLNKVDYMMFVRDRLAELNAEAGRPSGAGLEHLEA